MKLQIAILGDQRIDGEYFKVATTLIHRYMAEGARFELADELPHLRFSRPVRSAAPAPLQTALRVTRRLFIVFS